jgi:hypothetical protein
MSNYTIFYCDINKPSSIKNNLLERESKLIKKEKFKPSYSECPVWKHRNNRTFIVTSPIDVEFILHKNTMDLWINGECVLDPWEYAMIQDNDLFLENPTLQFNFPNYFFWTEDRNIWFEYIDHPLTSLNNNFIAMGGWFNISNYSRATSLAARIVDKTKPLKIKKGDPLARIRFFSNDFNDGIRLKKVTDPKIINKKLQEFADNQQIIRGNPIRNKILFGMFSECPFKFLRRY